MKLIGSIADNLVQSFHDTIPKRIKAGDIMVEPRSDYAALGSSGADSVSSVPARFKAIQAGNDLSGAMSLATDIVRYYDGPFANDVHAWNQGRPLIAEHPRLVPILLNTAQLIIQHPQASQENLNGLDRLLHVASEQATSRSMVDTSGELAEQRLQIMKRRVGEPDPVITNENVFHRLSSIVSAVHPMADWAGKDATHDRMLDLAPSVLAQSDPLRYGATAMLAPLQAITVAANPAQRGRAVGQILDILEQTTIQPETAAFLAYRKSYPGRHWNESIARGEDTEQVTKLTKQLNESRVAAAATAVKFAPLEGALHDRAVRVHEAVKAPPPRFPKLQQLGRAIRQRLSQ